MKILFIADTQIFNDDLIGIKKKLSFQQSYFESIGETTTVSRNVSQNIFSKLLILEKLFFWYRIYQEYRKERYNVIYIRDLSVFSGIFEILFLLGQKNAKRWVEIPSYPISCNSRGLSFMIYLYNQIFRSIFWRFYVNEIFFNGNFTESMYGIKATRINHFIGLNQLKVSNNSNKEPIFIMASSHQKYHGIERILDSFSSSNVSARLKVVGGTNETVKILSKSYENDNRIEFIPFLNNEELDRVMETGNIGISSMGIYKIGLSKTSGLKVAEYAARGLHVVLGYEDDVFLTKKFCYRVNNDSSTIPFDEIINWYNKSNYTPKQIRREILSETSWENFMTNQIFQ